MVRQHIRVLRLALLLGDGFAALGLFALVSMVRFGPGWTHTWTAAGAEWWVWAAGYGLLWAGAEWLQELDQLRSRWTFRGEVTDILRAGFVVAVGVFSVLFLVHAPNVSRLFLIYLFASQVGLSIVQRRALRLLVAIARHRGLGVRHLLVLGTGPEARAVAERLEQHPALAHRVLGYLGRPSESVPEVLGPLDAFEMILSEVVADELIAAFAADEVAYLEPVVAICQQTGRRVRVVLRPEFAPLSGGRVETLAGLEILTVSNGPDRVLGLAAKRILDIALAAARAARACAGVPPGLARDLARRSRIRPVPADPGRPSRPPIPDGQVPDHGHGCGAQARRADAAQRDQRAGIQARMRTRGSPAWGASFAAPASMSCRSSGTSCAAR